jgi:hypothetical protein
MFFWTAVNKTLGSAQQACDCKNRKYIKDALCEL